MRINIKDIALKNKGWSLYRLAKELGMPQQTIYSWSSGRTQPSWINMDKLCFLLECTMSDLFVPSLVCMTCLGVGKIEIKNQGGKIIEIQDCECVKEQS